MLALALVASFVASAVGQLPFPNFHKFKACNLASAINSNWKQLGAFSLSSGTDYDISDNWLAQFSVCQQNEHTIKVLLMAEGNKLQEWKVTYPDGYSPFMTNDADVADVACEKLHEIDMSHEKDNILVYASYQTRINDFHDSSSGSDYQACEVKNLVFANDFSKNNPSNIDWEGARKYLLKGKISDKYSTSSDIASLADDAKLLYKEIIDSVTTYQMSGAAIHQTFGQFNKTVALGLLEVVKPSIMDPDPFANFKHEAKSKDCVKAFEFTTQSPTSIAAFFGSQQQLSTFKLCDPTSFNDGKWYIRVQNTNERQRRDFDGAKFFPYYDPLMVYAPPSPLFARPPPVS